ncbi:unnamed protein product [Symbiodinium natans]|uniref:Uncharacterized protein n=1 Tax=Symbiodinium natans TaxID=878477 RepID=A0A812TW44_9DINO|nr:unnamed protein product [Symbiodinium natans]
MASRSAAVPQAIFVPSLQLRAPPSFMQKKRGSKANGACHIPASVKPAPGVPFRKSRVSAEWEEWEVLHCVLLHLSWPRGGQQCEQQQSLHGS